MAEKKLQTYYVERERDARMFPDQEQYVKMVRPNTVPHDVAMAALKAQRHKAIASSDPFAAARAYAGMMNGVYTPEEVAQGCAV